MGLGSVTQNNKTYLSVAGGYIWNRKAESTDPNYGEQEWTNVDGETKIRKGARYADLTGRVTNVVFKTHDKFGENINVTFNSDGEDYIISIGTNNRNSQDMMKALLKMDLTKPLFMKPYDFVGSDQKRAQGISFRQDGKKLELKVEDAPSKGADWFKSAKKKEIKRFFEDLTDWFIGEIEEKVIPVLDKMPKPEASQDESKQVAETTKAEAPKAEAKPEPKAETKKETPKAEAPKMTPLKMKKALKAYIAENYEGKELPTNLTKEQVAEWYDLSQKFEDLPFPAEVAEDVVEAEVPQDDIQSQLNALI